MHLEALWFALRIFWPSLCSNHRASGVPMSLSETLRDLVFQLDMVDPTLAFSLAQTS